MHQVRSVVEIPAFTMYFIYTSQVVIAGYLNHHHVSSMYLGKGLILICQPTQEGHFLIQVSLTKTTYVSKVCPNVLDVKKYQTLGNSSQVSQSQQVRIRKWFLLKNKGEAITAHLVESEYLPKLTKDESFGTFVPKPRWEADDNTPVMILELDCGLSHKC